MEHDRSVQHKSFNAAEIARALGGRYTGRGYLCRCPVATHGRGRGDRDPSLSISDGEFTLLVRCHAGCDPRDVLNELRLRGLFIQEQRDGARRWTSRPASCEQTFAQPRHDPDPAALDLWDAALPIDGTIAETYLRSRGLTATPASLRFLPETPAWGVKLCPALVAAVQSPSDDVIAVQLTFLAPDGSGKASVFSPRQTKGALGQGAIRLGLAGHELGLAEGTETALAAARLYGIPTWSVAGAGRMHKVSVPRSTKTLHIFADNDEAGRKAAEQTAAANSSRRVVIHWPPPDKGDFNDVLLSPQEVAA